MPNKEAHLRVAGEHATCAQGLYVFLFENADDLDVWDNPKNAARRKVVIPSRGSSLKAGKFEKGLGVRLAEYAAHLHRRRQDRTEWAFLDSFRGGYLFDMTTGFGGIPSPAAVFERYWVECFNAFAAQHSLLRTAQKARSEWRHLRGRTWPDELRPRFASYTDVAAQRIREMAAIAPLHPGQF